MNKVQVLSFSRLHFGLIDLSGTTQHADGSFGLYVRNPSIKVMVKKSNKFDIKIPKAYELRCENVFRALNKYKIPKNLQVVVETDISPHTGFGSGTQFSLALGTALLNFSGNNTISYTKLASILGRGGTSGIGVHSFKKGGFIFDGGRSWPYNMPKFGPSCIYPFLNVPPIISRLNFPQWGICIGIPSSNRIISGYKEYSLFKKFCPIPITEVEKICALIFLYLLPSLSSQNFELFCETMQKLRCLGFKKREIEYADDHIRESIRLLESVGLKGVSMSAWGPAVFGFADSYKKAKTLSNCIKDDSAFKKIIITKARNKGASIKLWNN